MKVVLDGERKKKRLGHLLDATSMAAHIVDLAGEWNGTRKLQTSKHILIMEYLLASFNWMCPHSLIHPPVNAILRKCDASGCTDS
jgi:hypothetical protein